MSSPLHFGERFSLAGKKVFISGASGGIGGHLAHLCAEAGAQVALAARRLDRLQATVAEIEDRGGRATAVALDLTVPSTIASALDAAEQAFDAPVDVLVNNAGVLQLGRFIDQEEADIDRTLNTNLKGAMLLAQEVSRRLIGARRSGSIVNIGSAGALRAGAWTGAYAAAKAGLMHLTRVMALELASKGIRANSLCPGNTDTDMIAALRSNHAAMAGRTPLGRLGQPSDLDGAFLLLASDAGRYITGIDLVVDGGLTLSWM